MSEKFIVLAVSFFLMILYLTKVYGDSPKKYKLSLIGEKNWSDISQLKLPKKQKKGLLYKSNVLYAAHNPYQADHVVAFSSNGKFKVEMRRTDEPLDEDLGVATIYDSLGNKIWEGKVGFWVYPSNNGDDFVSVGSEASVIRFHKISDTIATLDKKTPYVLASRYGITFDAKYFVGAGSTLELLTCEGYLIWRKYTNSPAHRELAFSYDASKIALSLMPHLLGWQVPQLTDTEDTVSKALPDRSIKNSYLFILNRDGEVLHKEILDWPVVHQMTFSPKGDFLAVGGYNHLSIFDVNAKKVIGKHDQNSLNFSHCSMAFSPSSDLLAIQSYGNLYLLNLKGKITDYARLTDDFDTSPVGLTLAFSASGKILLASTNNKLYAFKIEEK